MKQNYIDILISQLTESEKALLPKQLIINTVLQDNNNPNIQLYNLLLAKLNKNGVDDLDKRLQKLKKTYKLDNIIELIYKNRQKSNEQTIIQLLSKDENFFRGKCLYISDPKGYESIYSEITMCQKYQEETKLFLKFTLENGENCSFIDIHYKQDQILGVYTSQKIKIKLFELMQNFRQKNSTLPGYIEFFEQKQNFCKKTIKIEFGLYTLSFGEFKECGYLENGKYKAEYFLQKRNETLRYIIDMRYQDNHCSKIEKIYFKQNSEIEISLIELNSIFCYYFSEKTQLITINHNNAVENIKIQEVIYDENKEKQKKYEEIRKCKDDIFWELKQQQNQPFLDKILIDLVLNNFEFKTKVVLKVVTEKMDKIQQLNNQLNLEESQESILKNIVLEKGDTLQCLKVMDLLKQSFQHTENIKKMDIIIFLGATGSGKSTSINYYLGHDLEEYEKYGKKFLKLKDEKNLSQDSFAKIGHSLAVSETTFIQGYKVQGYDNLILCDCPGFDDTRGDIYDLNTMLSIDQTIKNCNSIKSIVLTISYETFFVNRCQGIVQLFVNLQQLIPDIFRENSAKDSVFILITKTNHTEINDHLMQLINDVSQTDKNILEKKNQSDFETIKLKQRIKIWQFVQYLISKKKILSYTITNQLMAEDQLELIINQPCINKKYFCKAMDRMDIQIAFSKYIVLQIDTWQREIFDTFFQDIPNQIKEAEGQILNKINSIKEKEKENNEKKNLIIQTQQKIKEAETQIKKLNELIQSGDQSQIIQELESNNKFSNFSSKILKDAQDEKENIGKEITEKQDNLTKNQRKIESLKEQISIIKNEIIYLLKEINQLSAGNSHKVLYDYKKLEEEMEFFNGDDDNMKSYNQAFDQVSRFVGQGDKQIVKTSEFTGELLHIVYIEKEFSIVPKGLTNQCQQMFNQDIVVDGKKYKAIIDGEYWSFEKGGKAQPDGKKMVYSIKTNWQKGRTLPWFRITHDLPNTELNKGTININNDKIDCKNRTIIQMGEEIKQLTKENNDIEKEIALKRQQIEQKEKIIQEVKKGLDRISSLTAFISNSKGEIELAQEFIKFNENVIKDEQEHISKKEQELKNLQKQHLHFAIIIKSKIEIAQLLKVFAKISIDGLGIDEKNMDANLKPSLQSYSQYYDKMITKIQNLCEETFRNFKNQYQKQLS